MMLTNGNVFKILKERKGDWSLWLHYELKVKNNWRWALLVPSCWNHLGSHPSPAQLIVSLLHNYIN